MPGDLQQSVIINSMRKYPDALVLKSRMKKQAS